MKNNMKKGLLIISAFTFALGAYSQDVSFALENSYSENLEQFTETAELFHTELEEEVLPVQLEEPGQIEVPEVEEPYADEMTALAEEVADVEEKEMLPEEEMPAQEDTVAELIQKSMLAHVSTEKAIGIPFEMVTVENGKFCMGEVKDASSKNVRLVSVQSFMISRTEVTQELYHAILGKDPSSVKGNSYPVTNINWYDAVYFCNKLSMAQGYTPCYTVNGLTNPDTWGYSPNNSTMIQGEVRCNYRADGYRLPTEAEWEYAAGGGIYNDKYKFSGSSIAGEVAAFSDTSAAIQFVKSYDYNKIGLYDLSGNVAEWCWDWYAKSYSSKDTDNPKGPSSGNQKAVRGGSYRDPSYRCQIYERTSVAPSNRLDYVGFRLVRHILTDRELAMLNAANAEIQEELTDEEIEILKRKDSAKRKSINFTVAALMNKESAASVYFTPENLLDFEDVKSDFLLTVGFTSPLSSHFFWGTSLGMGYMRDNSNKGTYTVDVDARIGVNSSMIAKDTLRLSAYLEAGYMNFGFAYGLGVDVEIMGLMTERNFGLGVDLFAAYDVQYDGMVHQAKAGCNIEILLPNIKKSYQ